MKFQLSKQNHRICTLWQHFFTRLYITGKRRGIILITANTFRGCSVYSVAVVNAIPKKPKKQKTKTKNITKKNQEAKQRLVLLWFDL